MTTGASDVQRLRATLQRAAQELAYTQKLLAEITVQYNPIVGEILATVGDSAQGVDKQMVEIMQSARVQTQAAIDVIAEAGGRIRQFAHQQL